MPKVQQLKAGMCDSTPSGGCRMCVVASQSAHRARFATDVNTGSYDGDVKIKVCRVTWSRLSFGRSEKMGIKLQQCYDDGFS